MARLRHLGDAAHRSYSSNNTAIASNWTLFADGAGNVVWTPVVNSVTAAGSNAQSGTLNLQAGSGIAITGSGTTFTVAATAQSTSFGSTAADVASSGAGGAASTSSRSDHAHRGVTAVTANSSNTLYGTVNLKAGTGIALGVSGQDVTFTNIGSGGGGGGGGGSGALVLLEQHTASSSATLDFTTAISATYDDYVFEILNLVPATNNVSLWMRCSTNGGSSYDAGNNYITEAFYMYSGGTGQDGNNSGAAGAMFLAGSVGNNTSYGVSGRFTLYSPGGSVNKMVHGSSAYSHQSLAYAFMEMFSGAYVSATAVNAVRFLFSSGNLSSGVIRCYGVAKS